MCEIFISKDIIKQGNELSLVKKYRVNFKSAKELLQFIEKNNYPKNLEFYINKGVLIEFF